MATTVGIAEKVQTSRVRSTVSLLILLLCPVRLHVLLALWTVGLYSKWTSDRSEKITQNPYAKSVLYMHSIWPLWVNLVTHLWRGRYVKTQLSLYPIYYADDMFQPLWAIFRSQKFLWPEDGPQRPKHVVSITNSIQRQLCFDVTTPS